MMHAAPIIILIHFFERCAACINCFSYFLEIPDNFSKFREENSISSSCPCLFLIMYATTTANCLLIGADIFRKMKCVQHEKALINCSYIINSQLANLKVLHVIINVFLRISRMINALF